MKLLQFIHYPKCSTCQKAYQDLKEKSVDMSALIMRDIVKEKLSYDELRTLKEQYGIELNEMWNVHGLLYKSLNLKEKRSTMSEEEQLRLLATDGMLVRRPILVTEDKAFFSYSPKVKKYFESESNT